MKIDNFEPFIKDLIQLQHKHNLTVILNRAVNDDLESLCGGINIFFTDNPQPILNDNEFGIKVKKSRSGKTLTIINDNNNGLR